MRFVDSWHRHRCWWIDCFDWVELLFPNNYRWRLSALTCGFVVEPLRPFDWTEFWMDEWMNEWWFICEIMSWMFHDEDDAVDKYSLTLRCQIVHITFCFDKLCSIQPNSQCHTFPLSRYCILILTANHYRHPLIVIAKKTDMKMNNERTQMTIKTQRPSAFNASISITYSFSSK